MEYDDNDIGGQNVQLNSEEIKKSSPVSSTFKYDFDDSIHGDIRFDSLVQNEIIGIGSQEDTSWIEDFSSGSGRIDVSTRADESDSISRRNNVWSEAASLDSVEMMLQSVGQEDVLHGDNAAEQIGAADESRSSIFKSTQNEEDGDVLRAKDVGSGVLMSQDELIHNFPDNKAVKPHQTEDAQSVIGNLCQSDDKVDFVLKETDAEKGRWPGTEDDQVMSTCPGDNLAIDTKHELNQIKADKSPESAQEDNQAPVEQVGFQVNCPQTISASTESLSSVLHQGSESPSKLNQNMQLNGLEVNMEEVEHMVMEKDKQIDDCEGHSAEKLRDEPITVESDTNNLKKAIGSSIMGHHDIHPVEVGLGQVDTLSTVKDCKPENDIQIDANAYECSNVKLESDSEFAGNYTETVSLISESCRDGKIFSDAPVTGSAGLQKNDELCGSTTQNEKSEECLVENNEICGAEEDALCSCTKEMQNTAELKNPKNSLTENDDDLGIPSGNLNSKLVVDDSSLGVVCSSAILAVTTHATEDSSSNINSVSEEKAVKEISTSPSSTVETVALQTTTVADLSDGNEKCSNNMLNVQSISKVSDMGDKHCNTGGLHTSDIIVAPSFESVCNTQNQGSPCESLSVTPAAKEKDSVDPEINMRSDVNYHGDLGKDDIKTEDSLQSQLVKDGTACSNDGCIPHDPKASGASDNDKTFSFIVTSSTEHPERETVKLWKPFAPQVPIISQNVDDSPLIPGPDHITLSNHGNHQTTDEKIIVSKNMSERKPRQASAKTNKKESAKRVSRTKSTTPSKLKESNIIPTAESALAASSMPTARQQHITDLQQLQLRAQIFVYGSLIQGTPPDEACMVAAFGGPDGGRSIWENARRQYLERIQGQKSWPRNPGTPYQQHSSPRSIDQNGKTSELQSNSNTKTPHKASRSISTTTFSGVMPPSSPLWTMQTPDRVQFSVKPTGTVLNHNAHPQVYSHSSSPMTSTVVHTTSWSPSLGPWVASPRATAPNANTPTTMHRKMEPEKLNPVRESSISETGARPTSLGQSVHTAGHTSGILEVKSPLIAKTSNLNPSQTPSGPKSRKRKQMDINKVSMVANPQPKVGTVSDASVSKILPTPTVASPSWGPKAKTDAFPFPTPTASSADLTTKGNRNVDCKIMMSEDMRSKVDEAKLHAEDAAAYAVAAVDHSREMWNQLAKQKDFGVVPDVEAQVSSAALAISAAVAVAKAAAAAANIAHNTAIQARLMAEEAIDSSRMSLGDSSTDLSLDSSVDNLGNVMQSSFSKGENHMNRSSIREKIVSASAASKRAENMDAIVKAAELAAEAVTQAGKVAAMGDPLPLSELTEAGPEGCWKLPKLSSELESRSNSLPERHVVDAKKEGDNASNGIKETNDSPEEPTDDCSLDLIPDEKLKLTSLVLNDKVKEAPKTANSKAIREGSFVEIYKEGDAIKAAWFSAFVMELKDGEAYVCYTDNPPAGSSKDSKEWVRLDIQENEAPKIRPAHPMCTMPSEGNRKRPREAMGICSWSVGDRVDAWRQNCWWEGVISKESSEDDTAVTVHFSALDETAIIKTCHLRPSLIWKDGEWVEWSSSVSYDGDMRQEKRMKLYDPEHEVARNDKEEEKVDATESKMHQKSRSLGLSAKETTFDVGKSSKDDKGPVTSRMARNGLQNEGKKARSGVPKPGVNWKLMDASQRNVSRDSKTNKNSDSTRSSKLLMPQASALPVWKNSLRTDMRENQMPATQLRVPSFRKPANLKDRTLEKNSVPTAASRNNNAPKLEAMTGFASYSSIGRARKSPFEFSSSSNEQSSKKTFASTSSKSEVASNDKFQPPSQKLGKIEEDKVYHRTSGTSVSEGLEPRRSVRRIQPTSRLLEGLQTSLSISKPPSMSHDKGLKTLSKNTSSRGKH